MLTQLRYLSLSILLTLPVVSIAGVLQGATISSTLTTPGYPLNFWDPSLSTPDTVAINTVVNDELGSDLYDNPEFSVPFGGSGSTGAILDIFGNSDPNDPIAALAFLMVSDNGDLDNMPFVFNLTFSGVNNGLSLIDVIVAEQDLDIDNFLFTEDSLTINVSAQEFSAPGERGIALVMFFGDVAASVPVAGTPLLLLFGSLLMWRRRSGVASKHTA